MPAWSERGSLWLPGTKVASIALGTYGFKRALPLYFWSLAPWLAKHPLSHGQKANVAEVILQKAFCMPKPMQPENRRLPNALDVLYWRLFWVLRWQLGGSSCLLFKTCESGFTFVWSHSCLRAGPFQIGQFPRALLQTELWFALARAWGRSRLFCKMFILMCWMQFTHFAPVFGMDGGMPSPGASDMSCSAGEPCSDFFLDLVFDLCPGQLVQMGGTWAEKCKDFVCNAQCRSTH